MKGLADIALCPKRVFEDGIRNRLVKKVTNDMHLALRFKVAANADQQTLLECRDSTLYIFSVLASRMAGFRSGLESVQDYLGIAGLKMWFEELYRIVGFAVE